MSSTAGDPRNTRAWRRLREQVFAEETHCYLCGEWVDQTLKKFHPRSRTVDHLEPLGRGGEGIPPRHMVRLACRRCNGRRRHDLKGIKPVHDREALSVDLSTV